MKETDGGFPAPERERKESGIPLYPGKTSEGKLPSREGVILRANLGSIGEDSGTPGSQRGRPGPGGEWPRSKRVMARVQAGVAEGPGRDG